MGSDNLHLNEIVLETINLSIYQATENIAHLRFQRHISKSNECAFQISKSTYMWNDYFDDKLKPIWQTQNG